MDLLIEDVDTFNDMNGLLEVSVVMSVTWFDPKLKWNGTTCNIKPKVLCKDEDLKSMPLDDASEVFWLPQLRMNNLINARIVGFYGGEVPTQLYYR